MSADFTIVVEENSQAAAGVLVNLGDFFPNALEFLIDVEPTFPEQDTEAFELSSTGELRFVNPPDFEVPLDSDVDGLPGLNTYRILVSAFEFGGDIGTLVPISLEIFVTDDPSDNPVVNAAPEFTSPPEFTSLENQLTVGAITASDPEGDPVTYSIAGGSDADLFFINPETGLLSFLVPPDFEAAGDATADNVYEVLVEAKDADGVSSFQNVKVNVADVDEPNLVIGNDYGEFLIGTGESDLIDARGGADVILAGSGNDIVLGGGGNDLIFGGNGDDVISGGSGDDAIFAGTGNSILAGGEGNDRLILGSGQDLIDYNLSADGIGEGNDEIIEFDQGLDKIDLVGLSGSVDDFDDLEIVQFGFDAIVFFDGVEGSLRFENFDAAALTAEDFIFADDPVG